MISERTRLTTSEPLKILRLARGEAPGTRMHHTTGGTITVTDPVGDTAGRAVCSACPEWGWRGTDRVGLEAVLAVHELVCGERPVDPGVLGSLWRDLARPERVHQQVMAELAQRRQDVREEVRQTKITIGLVSGVLLGGIVYGASQVTAVGVPTLSRWLWGAAVLVALIGTVCTAGAAWPHLRGATAPGELGRAGIGAHAALARMHATDPVRAEQDADAEVRSMGLLADRKYRRIRRGFAAAGLMLPLAAAAAVAQLIEVIW